MVFPRLLHSDDLVLLHYETTPQKKKESKGKVIAHGEILGYTSSNICEVRVSLTRPPASTTAPDSVLCHVLLNPLRHHTSCDKAFDIRVGSQTDLKIAFGDQWIYRH